MPEAEELLGSGNVGGGMLPKIRNCVDAIKSGVSRVHILDGRIEHCLLLEFLPIEVWEQQSLVMRRSVILKSMSSCMELAEEYVLHTYNRFPVVLERGEDVYLYDMEGKQYLDFGAGIAVFGLGYHYPGYDEALKTQIDKLIHTSNLYYNAPMAEAAEKLVKASGLDKVFLPTVVLRLWRAPLKRPENMPTQRTAAQTMRSLP